MKQSIDPAGDSHKEVRQTEATPVDGLSISRQQLLQVVFYSLLCGATSLIPIPFLDDWIFDLVRRYMAREFLREAGHDLTGAQIRAFVRRPSPWENEGCLGRLGYLLVIAPLKLTAYVLKKLFRKLVYVFTVKEATDRSVHTFHEAYLVVLGGVRNRSFDVPLNDHSLRLFRDSLRWTLQDTDTSAIGQLFTTVIKLNRALLSRAGKFLVATWRQVHARKPVDKNAEAGRAIHQEEAVLDQVTRETTDQILADQSYLEAFERRFEDRASRLGFRPQ